MDGIWMLLPLVTLLAIPFFNAKFQPSDLQEELEASFAEQMASVDGVDMPAKELEVLHRGFGAFSGGRTDGMTVMDAQWLCRSHDGTYLLGIAQGVNEKGRLVIHWTWRHLTEERARHSLLNDPKAYRAVFGPAPHSATGKT
jgi:hypothetical protein